METLSSQRQYQEISFNNECTKDQQIANKNFPQQNLDTQQKIQNLLQKVLQLQSELQKQKRKSEQLQKRNQQLTDMLVSASQSNVKRNQHFIRQVQRKIYNFQAKKQLTSNHFDSINKTKHQEEPYFLRMKTESGYESSKRLSKTPIKEARISEQRVQYNKENLNYLNQKTNLTARNQSKNGLKSNSDIRTDNLTQRSFNKNKPMTKTLGNDEFLNKVSSRTDFRKDLKIMSKIEAKMMRN